VKNVMEGKEMDEEANYNFMIVCRGNPSKKPMKNFRSLTALVGLSKSALNRSMLKAGYVTVPQRSCALLRAIPIFEKQSGLLREWTLKVLAPATPLPSAPVIEWLGAGDWRPSSPAPALAAFAPLSVAELREIECKRAEYEFFADPFCCPPAFLFDGPGEHGLRAH